MVKVVRIRPETTAGAKEVKKVRVSRPKSVKELRQLEMARSAEAHREETSSESSRSSGETMITIESDQGIEQDQGDSSANLAQSNSTSPDLHSHLPGSSEAAAEKSANAAATASPPVESRPSGARDQAPPLHPVPTSSGSSAAPPTTSSPDSDASPSSPGAVGPTTSRSTAASPRTSSPDSDASPSTSGAVGPDGRARARPQKRCAFDVAREHLLEDDTITIAKHKIRVVAEHTPDADFNGFRDSDNVTGKDAFVAFQLVSNRLDRYEQQQAVLTARCQPRSSKDERNDLMNGRFNLSWLYNLSEAEIASFQPIPCLDFEFNLLESAKGFVLGGQDEEETVKKFAQRLIFLAIPEHLRHTFTYLRKSDEKPNRCLFNVPHDVQSQFARILFKVMGVSMLDPKQNDMRLMLTSIYPEYLSGQFKKQRNTFNQENKHMKVNAGREYSPSLVSACMVRKFHRITFPEEILAFIEEEDEDI